MVLNHASTLQYLYNECIQKEKIAAELQYKCDQCAANKLLTKNNLDTF